MLRISWHNQFEELVECLQEKGFEAGVFYKQDVEIKSNNSSKTKFSLDVDFDLDSFKEDGSIFMYKGSPVLVYIYEQFPIRGKGFENNYNYHLTKCSKILSHKHTGQSNRYKASKRLDGNFLIQRIQTNGHKLNKEEVNLPVCEKCLVMLNYNNANQIFTQRVSPKKKRDFIKNFKISDFFKSYNGEFERVPKGISTNLELFKNTSYPKKSNEDSQIIRERGFKCESFNCGIVLWKDLEKFLFLVEGEVNCIECLSLKDKFSHLKDSFEYKNYLALKEYLTD